MLKFLGLTCALLLLLGAKPQSDLFSKYNSVEAYEIRPGILAMPTYAADGQVCEIGIEKRHYSPELIRVDPGLSQEEIDQAVNELVPADQRGPRSKDFLDNMISEVGNAHVVSTAYENILVETYGATSTTSKKKSAWGDTVAATIKWKNRTCAH